MQAYKSRQEKAFKSRAVANQVQRKTDREIMAPLTQLKRFSWGKYQASETAQLAKNSGSQQNAIASTPNHTGMSDHLKNGIEYLSGLDMSDVRVHYNSPKPAQSMAHAYGQRNQIYFGKGQERHLQHEAWHMVQQKQGRVRAMMQLNGLGVNDEVGLEREADVIGGRESLDFPILDPNYIHPLEHQNIHNQHSIQRVAFEENGQELKLTQQEIDLLKIDARSRYNMVNNATDIYLFKDKKNYIEYIRTGNGLVNHLNGVDKNAFTTNFNSAKDEAEKRQQYAPLISRTLSSGTLVDDNDFNELSENQLPNLPTGHFLYKEQNKYKRRSIPGAKFDFEMALYKNPGNNKLAYNAQIGGRTTQTLFQYGVKKFRSSKGREMAGLDGKGATPKWNTGKIKRAGTKRKFNNINQEPTMVQGHGQDFILSMKYLGDIYGGSKIIRKRVHNEKFSPITNSDQHPFNFSPEHPVYGKNLRNKILWDSKKDYKNGSILETTDYFEENMEEFLGKRKDQKMLPSGFDKIGYPKSKKVKVMNEKGIPQKGFVIEQLSRNSTKNKDFDFNTIDYSTYLNGVNKKTKTSELLNMLESPLDDKELFGTSFVNPILQSSPENINSNRLLQGDSATTNKKMNDLKDNLFLNFKPRFFN